MHAGLSTTKNATPTAPKVQRLSIIEAGPAVNCALAHPQAGAQEMSSDDEDAPKKNMRFSADRDFDDLTEINGEFYGSTSLANSR